MIKHKAYLELFGLKENATQDEIKKKYRQLAKTFHPDKNKEKNAHERFLLIQEAYDYLIKNINNYTQTTYYEEVDLEKERIEKIRKAKEKLRDYYINKKNIEISKILEFEKSFFWKIFKFFKFITISISILIILELFLPKKYEKSIISEISKLNFKDLNDNNLKLVKTLNNQLIYVNSEIYTYLQINDSVILEQTLLSNRTNRIICNNQFNNKKLNNFLNNSEFQIIIALLMLIPILIYKKKITSILYIKFVYFIFIFEISIILIYFL